MVKLHLHDPGNLIAG